jgi:hypothetical protein
MGADQISEIAPGIREVLVGAGGWCATFEVSGDPSRWVQFTQGTINAAYPYEESPDERLPLLGSCDLTEWEPRKYATFRLHLNEPRTVAKWIDRYFVDVLGCEQEYSIDTKLEDYG